MVREEIEKILERTNTGSIVTVDSEEFILIEDCLDDELLLNEGIDNVAMEEAGISDTVYEDEVFYCDNCNKYHYNDDRVVVNGCEAICQQSMLENIEDYIEEFINDPNRAIPGIVELEDWEVMDDEYEFGLSQDHNDTPESIMEGFNRQGKDIVFYVISRDPFNVYVGILARDREE